MGRKQYGLGFAAVGANPSGAFGCVLDCGLRERERWEMAAKRVESVVASVPVDG